MLRFIVKNKLPIHKFTVKNQPKVKRFVVDKELPKFLFLIRNRFYTDLVFLMDENDLLLLDESDKALVD